jgi:isopenicillin-N epimerase
MWALEPGITFLNHGSFGACPRPVLEAQARLREEMERQPVRFLARELEARLDAARAALAAFVGADPDDLAFVPNATTGVNTVLRSLPLGAGDEILATDHLYPACRAALRAVVDATGARVVVARIPFPIGDAGDAVRAVLEAAGPRTRLALVEHVTSPTGLVLPVRRIVGALAARGIDTLVDGAHAPGMVPLDLRALGAAYYTGNCHKWLCAPKGAAFLHVRRDRQPLIRPLVVSHGAGSPRTDRSRFSLEFDWTGTDDPTPYLAVPEAIRVMGRALPGGWAALMARNRALALEARGILAAALGADPPCPDDMIGALASLPLPDGPPHDPPARDELQAALLDRFRIEVPVIAWPAPPRRLLRISAQLYNGRADYERLAGALRDILGS